MARSIGLSIPRRLGRYRVLVYAWDFTDGPPPDVRWFEFGAVWERDGCFTPVLESTVPSAPVMMFSGQALWRSMVFPTEASLLEAFAITFETMGFETDPPGVNPFFVEWLIAPPKLDGDTNGPDLVHSKLAARSKDWQTDHRCWSPELMPYNSDDAAAGVDPVLASTLFGIASERVRIERD